MTASEKTTLSASAIRWSIHIFLVLILNQIHRNVGSPVFTYNPSVAQFHIQSGRNIRHLPCVVRRSGVEGVCMFAIDCIKANGTHLGTCIDRFYFGSCCQLKDDTDIVEPDIVENSIDQNTIPHFSFGAATASTPVNSLHSTTPFPRIPSITKVSAPPKSTVTSTIDHQKTTISTKPSTSPETTTYKFVPITLLSNTESKTEASNEQPIIDKIPDTTIRNVIASKIPTTTEENIKLQTFQSVQDTTFTTSAPPNMLSTSTKRPTIITTRTISTTTSKSTLGIKPNLSTKVTLTTKIPPKKPTTPQTNTPVITKASAEPLKNATIASVTSTTQLKPRTTVSPSTTQRKPVTTTTTTTTKTTAPTATTIIKITTTTTNAPSKRPEQSPATKITSKPTAHKTTTSKPSFSSSTEKHLTNVTTTHSTYTITKTSPPSVATSVSSMSTLAQTKRPAPTISSSTSHSTSGTMSHSAITRLNATKPITTPTPDLVTWSNAETVKTEYPPEWILIPSVLPLLTTISQPIPNSTRQPETASTNRDTTRFPTRKPTEATTKASMTKKPITRPTFETAATKPATKQPLTTASSSPSTTTTTTTAATTTTTTTEKSSVTPHKYTTQPAVFITTTEEEEEEEGNASTTESATMFDDIEDETTVYTEISKTEPNLSYMTTDLPLYSQPSSSSTGAPLTVSKFNSTIPISLTVNSVTTASTPHTSADSSSVQPVMTTAKPSVTLTTILMPSIQQEHNKIPTHKPVSDLQEKTTTSTPIAPSTLNASSTIAYNQTTVQPSTVTLATEPSDKFTTVQKIESTSEAITVEDAASPNVPLTTFEAYDVENSTLENVTLEFVDLPTTEAISSTTNTLQYLETASYKEVCGKRMYPEPRIVGGSKASFGRWPWQISLRQWRTSTYLHKCGAALLNENWAITAAHCVDNVPPSDLLLRLGEYDLAEEEEPYLYQERRVQIVASHPQFDPRTFEYDLALLRFYEPVAFQPNIIPVCVPDSDENFIGRTAFVTGWGRLYEDGPLPSVLQEVSVPVINNTLCEGMYRNAGYIEHIPHIFICAGWRKGGYDSCEGDSGGPMVIQREDKRFLLAGVISWGIGCAEPNQPGVYTRISEFREWINQILQF